MTGASITAAGHSVTANHEARHAATAFQLAREIEVIKVGNQTVSYSARTQVYRPRWYRDVMNSWVWRILSPSIQTRCLRCHAKRLIVIGFAGEVGRGPNEPDGNFDGDRKYIQDCLTTYFPRSASHERLCASCRQEASAILSSPETKHIVAALAGELSGYITDNRDMPGKDAMRCMRLARIAFRGGH